MIAPSCYPPRGAEGLCNAKLVLAFQNAGWDVDVISCGDDGRPYPNAEEAIWSGLNGITTVCPAKHGWNIPNLVGHMKAAYRTGHSIHGISWAGEAISVGRKLLLTNRYDVILSRSEPSQLAALVLSRESGVPWIANWNDPFPKIKFPPPYGFGPNSLISWWMQRYFDAVTKQADWHTFPSERLRRYMCTYMPNNVMQKSSVVPHIALDCLRNKLVRTGTSSETFTLCHVGNVDSQRDPSVFLKGIRIFLNQFPAIPNICVKFTGIQGDGFDCHVHELGLADIISCEKPRSYLDTLQEMAAADICVVIEAKCSEGIFLPSKFVDYVQCWKPILSLSPVTGTINDLFEKHGGGIAVDCRSPEEVAKGVNICYDYWKEGVLEKEYSSSELLHLFEESTIIAKYHDMFRKLVMR